MIDYSRLRKTACLSPDFEREMLARFHLSLADERWSRRGIDWTAITASEWAREKEQLRGLFLAMFGPFPARAPLNPRVTGTLKGSGFTVEKVMFDSIPGMPITANCYVPDGLTRSAPGIVLACGEKAMRDRERASSLHSLRSRRKNDATYRIFSIGELMVMNKGG